jgi:hypothetical protein
VEAEAEVLDHRVGIVGTVLFVVACLFVCGSFFVWLDD